MPTPHPVRFRECPGCGACQCARCIVAYEVVGCEPHFPGCTLVAQKSESEEK